MTTTYKVLAETGFNGYKAGDEFEADLDPDLEAHGLEREAIEIVKGQAKKTKEGNDA